MGFYINTNKLPSAAPSVRAQVILAFPVPWVCLACCSGAARLTWSQGNGSPPPGASHLRNLYLKINSHLVHRCKLTPSQACSCAQVSSTGRTANPSCSTGTHCSSLGQGPEPGNIGFAPAARAAAVISVAGCWKREGTS